MVSDNYLLTQESIQLYTYEKVLLFTSVLLFANAFTKTFQNAAFANNSAALLNAPGCATFGSGFTLVPASTLTFEVNGKSTACLEFDRITITGTATIAGQLNVIFGGSYTPVIGDNIIILKSTSFTGTFNSNNLPAGWVLQYNFPGTGNITLSFTSVLPLTLTGFNVKMQGQTAIASWRTTDEVNTNYFDLERSENGNEFKNVTTVPAMNAPGSHSYSMADPLPADGLNYYRLKMVDIDGRYTYSTIVSLNIDKPKATISVIFPNPAKDIVNFAVAKMKITCLSKLFRRMEKR